MTRVRLLSLALSLAVLSPPGCGGKAIDDQSGGDGDGDGPAVPSDPLSDEGFPDAFEDRFDEYCEKVEGCDVQLDRATCEEVKSQVSRFYDVESRECRSLILESLDCMSDTWRNCAPSSTCSSVDDELNERCALF